MTIEARETAIAAVERLRAQPWGLAVAVVADGETEILVDPGGDELDEHSHFQIGSVTKTMTGLLVAGCVVRGEASLHTTVGAILGSDAGNCGSILLLDLAAQHSGLPRLPSNLDTAKIDPQDPYANYTEGDLLKALRMAEEPTPAYGYSNFGFMLLGLLLVRISGMAYAELIQERVFRPLGMGEAICGIPPEERRLPCYAAGVRTPWWSTLLPGAGGVACGISDLARYIAAHLEPPDAMAAALDLALAEHRQGPPPMGLGWVHQGGGHWHNGATGGFRSFVAIHRPSRCGVALLANSADPGVLDKTGMAILTQMARSQP